MSWRLTIRSDARDRRWWIMTAAIATSAVAAAYWLDPELAHLTRTSRRRIAREARRTQPASCA
jgi:hypothetical protein